MPTDRWASLTIAALVGLLVVLAVALVVVG